MPRQTEITLDRDRASRLVAVIRQQVVEWARRGEATEDLNRGLDEARFLAALFDERYEKEGAIVIAEEMAPTVLRAASALRLRLRAGPLATASDEELERGPEFVPEYILEDVHMGAYLLLARLQEDLLVHLGLSAPGAKPWMRILDRSRNLVESLRRSWTGTPRRSLAAGPESAGPWQVVLHNDPVNLMTYVSAVLREVAGLPADEAEQRVLEVHEAKRSTVWRGAKPRAEALAQELRSWHLRAEAQPIA